jgi:hypothetical protein
VTGGGSNCGECAALASRPLGSAATWRGCPSVDYFTSVSERTTATVEHMWLRATHAAGWRDALVHRSKRGASGGGGGVAGCWCRRECCQQGQVSSCSRLHPFVSLYFYLPARPLLPGGGEANRGQGVVRCTFQCMGVAEDGGEGQQSGPCGHMVQLP